MLGWTDVLQNIGGRICTIILLTLIVVIVHQYNEDKFRFVPVYCNNMEHRDQIDSSTLDGNVELIHTQHSCILTKCQFSFGDQQNY